MTLLITDAELLAMGIATDALSGIASGTRDTARAAASSVVLSFLRKRFGLPLVSWSDDVKRATAHIAAWDLLAGRGYNPLTGGDPSIKLRADAAFSWLRDVVDGRVEPEDVVDSTPDVDERSPLIASSELSGWDYPAGSSGNGSCCGGEW